MKPVKSVSFTGCSGSVIVTLEVLFGGDDNQKAAGKLM